MGHCLNENEASELPGLDQCPARADLLDHNDTSQTDYDLIRTMTVNCLDTSLHLSTLY